MAATSEAHDGRPASAGDQLAWERRFGPRAGAAALGGAMFMIASFVSQLSLLRVKTKTEADTLRAVHAHASGYVAGGVLQLVALLFLAVVLYYLYRAARYRRPQTPTIGLVLGVAGPILFGIVGAIGPFVIRHYAMEFVNGANHTNQHAKDLVSGGAARAFGIATLPTGLAFAFAVIITNINSMRAGLVSTFVGIIGVIGGLLFVLPLGPPQLLLFFWLTAMTVILFDRWPGGRGPAWELGEAVKWPTAMERRTGAAAGRAGARSPAPSAQEEEPAEQPSAAAARTSRKRKRKQGRKH
jgi:membrane protein implicated in regulation of membrane protease activity